MSALALAWILTTGIGLGLCVALWFIARSDVHLAHSERRSDALIIACADRRRARCRVLYQSAFVAIGVLATLHPEVCVEQRPDNQVGTLIIVLFFYASLQMNYSAMQELLERRDYLRRD